MYKISVRVVLFIFIVFNFLCLNTFGLTQMVGEEEEKNQQNETIAPWNGKSPSKGFKGEDEDGAYNYEESNDEGSKEVGESPKTKPSQENLDNGLRAIMSDGSYLYKVEMSEHHNGASLRIGPFSPPNISVKLPEGSEISELTYADIYSNKPLSAFLFDYSWDKVKWGVWSFTVGTGMAQATANGRFVKHPLEQALEKYTFYLIPNHISLTYKFQYKRRPWFVPYVTGGYCPFGLAEIRDDGASKKLVSAHAISGAAGIKFNISSLDPESAYSLDAEYGIGNVWFDFEARIYKGLQQQRDVSSTVINGGIGFDF